MGAYPHIGSSDPGHKYHVYNDPSRSVDGFHIHGPSVMTEQGLLSIWLSEIIIQLYHISCTGTARLLSHYRDIVASASTSFKTYILLD